MSGVPLAIVQKEPEVPLMITARDQVAAPSVDWLKTMGLRLPIPPPVPAWNRVQVTYTRPFFALPGRESATISSLSWAMFGSMSLATLPIGSVKYA